MQTQIEHTVFYAHSAQDVWDYLTRPELIEQWLMRSDFKPEVGHRFMFWTKPLPQFSFDGNIYCEVLEVVPFKKLSYTWRGGASKDEINLDSVVVWTLTEKEGGTELHLVHSGFNTDVNPGMFMAMNEGWLRNMRRIDDLVKEKK